MDESLSTLFIASDTWKATYPGAAAGMLAVRDVTNPPRSEALEARKVELEARLRERFGAMTRADLRAVPPLDAYEAYFRRYRKTFHVRLQLESVALKGKPIPSVATLVEAMFVAELEHLLLTAGHDLDTLALPVRLDVATGGEPYTLLGGQEASLEPGDMYMADGRGVISSILFGPDSRTRMTSETRAALFAVYAPPGIGAEAVDRHLAAIEANVRLVAPEARVAARAVIVAG